MFHNACRWLSSAEQRFLRITTTFTVAIFFSLSAPAQSFTVIHNFSGGADGGQPTAGPTLDRSGNLYGTSFFGGSGFGIVYKASHHGSSWLLNPLYSFTGQGDGALPYYGAVALGPDGTPYGTTSSGGIGESGTVFNVRPRPNACNTVICPWMDTTVHQFGTGTDGIQPTGGVIFDSAGNMYGTTFHGGATGNGTVWEATRSGQNWTESVIYNFAGGGDGGNPVAGVIMDANGNLYGTTYDGGTFGFGTVYQLTRSGSNWTKSILYIFQNGTDGRAPSGGLVFDNAGNLYGTTSFGGSNGGGTVYELTAAGGVWNFTTLVSFSGTAGPYNNLTLDSAGNLYGTTYRDGVSGAGSVFKLTQSGGIWFFSDLHDFTGGSDGGFVTGGVAVDSNGNVFGTTQSGGSSNQGVIFEITP